MIIEINIWFVKCSGWLFIGISFFLFFEMIIFSFKSLSFIRFLISCYCFIITLILVIGWVNLFFKKNYQYNMFWLI
jgi:hypothetical protein